MVDVAVTGPYGECFHEVLTDDALEFLAGLHRAFDTRRLKLVERRRQRYHVLAEGGTLDDSTDFPTLPAISRCPERRMP